MGPKSQEIPPPMDFGYYEDLPPDHPWFSIFQRNALSYIKRIDLNNFSLQFSGEVDREGHLINIDGTSSDKFPSQIIHEPLDMNEVVYDTQKDIS